MQFVINTYSKGTKKLCVPERVSFSAEHEGFLGKPADIGGDRGENEEIAGGKLSFRMLSM